MFDLIILRFGAIGDLLLCAPAINLLGEKGTKIIIVHANFTPTKFFSRGYVEGRRDLKIFFHHNIRIITVSGTNIFSIRKVITSISRKFRINRILYLPHYGENLKAIIIKNLMFNTNVYVKNTKKGIHKSLSIGVYIFQYLDIKKKLSLSNLIDSYNVPANITDSDNSIKNIVISVSAAKEHKQWGYNNFKELISRLYSKDLSVSITLIAMEDDRQFVAEVTKLFPDVRSHIQPSFGYLAEVLKRANLVVCNEGGFGHMAARFTSDIVVLANSIEVHGIVTPMATGVLELRRQVGCVNCGCFENCPVRLGERCIDIEVSKVTDQIFRKLGS